MAKLVKKKRKLRINAIASLFFFISIFLYLGSMTALKSYNVVLSAQAETALVEREKLQDEVNTLETAVKTLSNSDRIAKIAEDNGIKAIQSNVRLLTGE